MFNAEKPNFDELPSSAQLLKSTLLALISAIIILVAVILPAEYGIDPTGAGRVLGLTEMGEIKQQLEEEAGQDHSMHDGGNQKPSLLDGLMRQILSPAYAQSADEWKDEATFMLEPGATHELKLTMKEGDVVEFRMEVEGGRVNYDHHAHGSGQSTTYEKGRGSTGSEGEFVAKFDGNHGWFWRNRDKKTLTIKLQVRGTYSAFKQGE